MRSYAGLVVVLATSWSLPAFADDVVTGGICEIDPSACPKATDLVRSVPRKPKRRPLPPPKPPEEPQPVEEVSVRAKPPPRSASDWEVDDKTLATAPHGTAADAMNVVPGVFIGERGLLGRAPRLSLRGFEGTSGQDVEIFLGNIPLNQASNIRAPGYADMRLVMPEIMRSVRITSGPYDPRQGDFAVAGSVRMEGGLAKPGFLGKGTYGSFGTKRMLLAFAPENRHWRDSFAAFEAFSTDGPGTGGRTGERTSFIGQLAFDESQVSFKGIVAIGSARFDFPGYLLRDGVDRGAYPYEARYPLGRDRTSQAHIGTEVTWIVGRGTLALGAWASKTKMAMLQNNTGYVLDVLGGFPPVNPDAGEQVNDGSTLGMHTAYKHVVELLSKRDIVELGAYARLDSVDQTDTRLRSDSTINTRPIDATISAMNLAAFLDAWVYPIRRVVVRGGTRLDSLSYSVKDRASTLGIERTAQGFHLGNKLTMDVAIGGGSHLVASYGEGFRSPQARMLQEGDRVPFATVHSVETGVRTKQSVFRGTATGFGSWLSQDRVFDPLTRENAPAPASRRIGVASAIAAQASVFLTSLSATYTHASFIDSDARFREGAPVPYAPRFVVRADTSAGLEVGSIMSKAVRARAGLGLEGAAFRYLPDGTDAKNAFFVDALASVGWREFDLGVNGTNLLNVSYFDAQYLYVSNFTQSPALPTAPAQHVLVAMPTSVFVTLEVHLQGRKEDQERL